MNKKLTTKLSVFLLFIYVPLMLSINFWHSDNWNLGKSETVFSVESASNSLQESSDFCSVCSFINSHSLAETTEFEFKVISSISLPQSSHVEVLSLFSFASLRAPPLA